MPIGSLLQLSKVGTADVLLINNPKISYFKYVYRTYTPFAKDLIDVYTTETSSTGLHMTNDSLFEFKLDRYGDLINYITFIFTLPDIYSNHSGTPLNCNFAWIKYIGEFIIKELTFILDGQEIEKQLGEWLHIWGEITMNTEKKNSYHAMIGHVPALYAPDTVPHISGYPASSATVPSIIGRDIIVPLGSLFFCSSTLRALPLAALLYNECKIRILMRPLRQLYTLVIASNRQAPSADAHNIGRFLSHDATNITYTLPVNPRLEVSYISIGMREREMMLLNNLSYLFKQIKTLNVIEKSAVGARKYVNIDLKNFYGLTASLYWILRRSDMEDLNQWHNFTNYPLEDYNPLYSYSIDANPFGTHSYDAVDTASFLNRELMLNAVVKLEGQDRIKEKPNYVYGLVDRFNCNKSVGKTGIYSYGFQVNDDDLQPSGHCNLSEFDNKILGLTLAPAGTHTVSGVSAPYNYNIYIFTQMYNIFSVFGGSGGIKFTN